MKAIIILLILAGLCYSSSNSAKVRANDLLETEIGKTVDCIIKATQCKEEGGEGNSGETPEEGGEGNSGETPEEGGEGNSGEPPEEGQGKRQKETQNYEEEYQDTKNREETNAMRSSKSIDKVESTSHFDKPILLKFRRQTFDTLETFPKCLEGGKEKVNIGKSITTSDKLLKLEIVKGSIELTQGFYEGLKDYTFDFLNSHVTVIPLGIEFTFVLRWTGITFKAKYDFTNDLQIKAKDETIKPVTGDPGYLTIKLENLKVDIVAHKLLGSDLDYTSVKFSDFTVTELTAGIINIGDEVYNLSKKDLENQLKSPEFSVEVSRLLQTFINTNLPTLNDATPRAGMTFVDEAGKCVKTNFIA